MGRRLLEGDSKVWIKIDNQQNEVSDAVEIYKPGKAKKVASDSLFIDEQEMKEDKQNELDEKRRKQTKILITGLVTVVIVLIGIVLAINN